MFETRRAIAEVTCCAGRRIQLSQALVGTVYITAVDGVKLKAEEHDLGYDITGYSQDKVARCGRCIGSPTRQCDQRFGIFDLDPQTI